MKALIVFISLANAQVATTLAPYIEKFNQEAINANKRVIVPNVAILAAPSELKGNASLCITQWQGTSLFRIILVDAEEWKKWPEHCKEEAIAHEMFHCSYGLKHSPNSSDILYDTQRCRNYGPKEIKKMIQKKLKLIPTNP